MTWLGMMLCQDCLTGVHFLSRVLQKQIEPGAMVILSELFFLISTISSN